MYPLLRFLSMCLLSVALPNPPIFRESSGSRGLAVRRLPSESMPPRRTATSTNNRPLLASNPVASRQPNHNTHVGVRNVNGTGSSRYADSKSRTAESWLAMWREETRSTRSTCGRLQCSKAVAVGGHVIRTDGRHDKRWYIAPLCYACNLHTNTETMWMKNGVALVPLPPSHRSRALSAPSRLAL